MVIRLSLVVQFREYVEAYIESIMCITTSYNQGFVVDAIEAILGPRPCNGIHCI